MSNRSDLQAAKVLQVGPLPPPHGGVAVHLANLRGHLESRGVRCEAFDPSLQGRGRGPALLQVAGVARAIRRFARRGWTIHVHTNGHNRRSWLLALLAGIAARRSPGTLLTLHSGILPDYLDDPEHPGRRRLARIACRLYDRVIGVNQRIDGSLARAGVDADRRRVIPAWTGVDAPTAEVPEPVERWMDRHGPVLVSTLAFRPEYRFGWQLATLVAMRSEHPDMGLAVIGDGDGADAARRQIRQHGLEGDVLLLGDVPHDRCLAILSRCDLFLRTTSHDGDALSVREALALGVPVVASDVGFRPTGTRLFPANDFRALLRETRAAVAEGRLAEAPGAELSREMDGADIERLLHLYGELAPPAAEPRQAPAALATHGILRGGRR